MTVSRRNPAYLLIALFFVGIVAWGFWRSYFRPLLDGSADRPWLVHLHAAVFVGWVLLLVLQAGLAAAGRVDTHRRIGTAGMIYGSLVFLAGVLVSVGGPALRVRNGEFGLETAAMVAVYSLADLLLFGLFLALAFVYRFRPQVHKQWVICATAALGGAAVGRVLDTSSALYLLVWLSPVLALILVDLLFARKARIAPFVATAAIVAAFFKMQLLAGPVWRNLGSALIAPFV